MILNFRFFSEKYINPKLYLMSRMYDIITVGSATVDVFANTESELIKIKTSNPRIINI